MYNTLRDFNRIYLLMNKFFKAIGLLIIILFGIVSASFTGTAGDQVYISFGTDLIGSFPILYAISIVYFSAILMFWGSLWGLSRGMLLFFVILSFVFFGALLNNSALFISFKPPVFILAAPFFFYLFASLRFLKRYAVGHSYVQLFKI